MAKMKLGEFFGCDYVVIEATNGAFSQLTYQDEDDYHDLKFVKTVSVDELAKDPDAEYVAEIIIREEINVTNKIEIYEGYIQNGEDDKIERVTIYAPEM